MMEKMLLNLRREEMRPMLKEVARRKTKASDVMTRGNSTHLFSMFTYPIEAK